MPSLTDDELAKIDAERLAGEIASDVLSDFVIAPHFDALLKSKGSEFVAGVMEGLKAGYAGPRPPIQILVPKAGGHYRPGSILEPGDRVVYHIIAALAFQTVGKFDGDRSFSRAERTLALTGGGQEKLSAWDDYAARRNEITEASAWVLLLDLAHYFERIPQHALVNLLQAEGLSANAKSLTEGFLQNVRMRDSHGILQGMLPSDYLGDLFLTRLDAFLERRGLPSVRFVDDVVIGGASQADLRNTYHAIVEYLRGFGLQPNESKTRIVPAAEAHRTHTELDDMFADARQEAVEELEGISIVYGLGINWAIVDEVDADVELTATKRLLEKLDDDPNRRQQILRFVLSALSRARDPEAVDIVLTRFGDDAFLSRDFARYLVAFADEESVITGMASVISNPEHYDPFQLMHAVAVLNEARTLPRSVVRRLQALYDVKGHSSVRALAAVAVARHGDGTARQDLGASFPHESSDYVRAALVYAAQYFVAAERRTARKIWGPYSDLCALIASRVLQG